MRRSRVSLARPPRPPGRGIRYRAHSPHALFEPDATTEAEPIRREQFVARTPARVWAALTEPAALARW